MRKAIHSEEDIIEKMKTLEGQLNYPPSPWEVHRALGGKGKFDRIAEIIENHRALQAESKAMPEIALPVDIETQIDTALEALRAAMNRIATGLASNLVDENRRQFSLQQRDHLMQQHELQKVIHHLREENAYLKELLEETEIDEGEEQAEDAEANPSAPSPAEPAPEARAPEAVSSAAHKFSGRALPKTRPALLRPRSAQQRRRKSIAADRRQT